MFRRSTKKTFNHEIKCSIKPCDFMSLFYRETCNQREASLDYWISVWCIENLTGLKAILVLVNSKSYGRYLCYLYKIRKRIKRSSPPPNQTGQLTEEKIYIGWTRRMMLRACICIAHRMLRRPSICWPTYICTGLVCLGPWAVGFMQLAKL